MMIGFIEVIVVQKPHHTAKKRFRWRIKQNDYDELNTNFPMQLAHAVPVASTRPDQNPRGKKRQKT